MYLFLQWPSFSTGTISLMSLGAVFMFSTMWQQNNVEYKLYISDSFCILKGSPHDRDFYVYMTERTSSLSVKQSS